MKKMKKGVMYCSSCRYSKYALDGLGRLFLRCEQRVAFGLKGRLPTDCTDAEECLDYVPERMRDALSTRHKYSQMMRDCGIPLSEEKGGVLSEVRLR